MNTDSNLPGTGTETEMEMWQDRDNIVGRPIAKTLRRLTVPAVLSTFFTVIFEIIDMFWIGKLGAVSIAALSASSFYVWMLRGLGLIVATGAIALVSRRSGEKDEKGILTAITNAAGSSFLFSLLIMLFFFPPGLKVFQWIGLEPAVAAGAVDYAIVFLSGLVFVYLMMTFEFVLRGLGDTRTPMIFTGISLLLNALLDPVFIFYAGMGLKGAAVATILSQAIGALLMAAVILKKIPRLKSLSLSKHILSLKQFGRQFVRIITIGGPMGLSDAGFSLIYIFLSGIISVFGKEPLAAVGIAHRIEALPFFISLGFSMAVAPMVGQYLGAGKPEDAKKTVYLALKVCTAILAVISILFFVFAPALFRFFTADPLIVANGARYLRIVALFDVFLAFEIVLGGAFSGAGDTRPPFFIVFPITTLRIPAAYFLAVTANMGRDAIWVVIAVTTMLKGVMLLYWFNKGNWAKKKI
jgi:putative MATE family efflux protein